MSNAWLRVQVTCDADDLAPLIVERLIELGASAVEQDGDRLRTYLPQPPTPDAAAATAARVSAVLCGLPGVAESTISITPEPARDWLAEWRAGLAPRRVGRRLVVAPTWSDVGAAPDDIILRIDPQMAFGTGEHASTRGVLRLLERAVASGAVVLDVGTGSGILAIAAARLGAATVLAVDNDANALINARENIEANAVADNIRIEHAAVDDTFLASCGTRFDVITANVLSGVLVPLLNAFGTALAEDGVLLLGGILHEEAAAVLEAANAAGLAARAEDREEEWWSVWLEAQ